MNIDFLKTKKNFNKKNYQIDPNAYWRIILLVVLIMVLASFVYGFYVLLETNRDSFVSSANTNDQIEKNRKTRIDNILQYFSDREKKSEIILNSPSPIVDPSL
jgi:hypothetical protein